MSYTEMLGLTIGEIQLMFNGINKKLENENKYKLSMDYNLAVNTATFTIMLLNGNGSDIPSLQKLYPDIFGYDADMVYLEQFKAFAIKHNNALKKREEE